MSSLNVSTITAVELDSFGEGITFPPSTLPNPIRVEPIPTYDVPYSGSGWVMLQPFTDGGKQLRMNMVRDLLIALPEYQLRKFENYGISCDWDDVYKLEGTTDLVVHRVPDGIRSSWFFNLLTDIGKERINRLLSTRREEPYHLFALEVHDALQWTRWNQDPIYTAAVASCLVENYVENNPRLFHSQFDNAEEIIENFVRRKGWVKQWEGADVNE